MVKKQSDSSIIRLIGWGKVQASEANPSPKLRMTSLQIFSQAHCNQSHVEAEGFTAVKIKNSLPDLFTSSIMCAGFEVIYSNETHPGQKSLVRRE